MSLRPKSTQDYPFRLKRHWHAREGPSATYSGRGPTRTCRGQGLQGMAKPGVRPLSGGSWVCTGPWGWRGRAQAEGGSLPDPCRRDLESKGAAGEGDLHPRPAGPPRGCPCPSARMFGPPLAPNCRYSGCSDSDFFLPRSARRPPSRPPLPARRASRPALILPGSPFPGPGS